MPHRLAKIISERFESELAARRVLRRIGMEFNTQEALNQYLKQHPKAKPSNHSVKKTETPAAAPAPAEDDSASEDRKDTAADLAVFYRSKDNSAIAQLISLMEEGKAPSVDQLQSAKEQASKLWGVDEAVIRTLKGILSDVQAAPTSATKAKPKPKPAPQQQIENKPPAQEAPPKDVAPVTVKRTGVGKGSGKIELPGTDDKRSATFRNLVERCEPTREQRAKTSHVGEIMRRGNVSKEHVKKCSEWAAAWVCGVTDSVDPGRMSVTPSTRVHEFLDDLAKPEGWARAQYDATQATIRAKLSDLQKRGVMDKDGFITLYRGIKPPQDEAMRGGANSAVSKTHAVKAQMRGLSCWSEDPREAQSFTEGSMNQVVLEQKVHFSRIVSMWEGQNDSWHKNNEREWTVLSGEDGISDCTMHSRATLKTKIKAYKAPPDN